MKHKVAVGLSGGVDSAVSAALLKDQGDEVTGVFLICYQGPGCRTDEDRKDALDVALKLKIPFEVLDFRKEYQAKVLEYFKAEYKAGRTPNPDVVCNKEIKFGLFYDWAMKKGYEYIATGHYACVRGTQETRNKKQETRLKLQVSTDKHKDQTYFLYQLKEEQLAHILFPVGGMTKAEVRGEAEKRKLSVAKKPDSQGICFVGEVSVPQFLKDNGVKEELGDVCIKSASFRPLSRNLYKNTWIPDKAKAFTGMTNVESDYLKVGEHKGVWFYTIGQRHGFTIENQQPDSTPLYVVDKDAENNRLIVGTKNECMKQEFEVGELHWVGSEQRTADNKLQVRIRHGGELIQAKLTDIQNTKYKILLAKPAFGVAPGQSCVFYKGEICLGGGVII